MDIRVLELMNNKEIVKKYRENRLLSIKQKREQEKNEYHNETEDDIMYIALLKANQRATGKVLKYIFVPEYMCVLPFMDKVYDEDEDVIQSNLQD